MLTSRSFCLFYSLLILCCLSIWQSYATVHFYVKKPLLKSNCTGKAHYIRMYVFWISQTYKYKNQMHKCSVALCSAFNRCFISQWYSHFWEDIFRDLYTTPPGSWNAAYYFCQYIHLWCKELEAIKLVFFTNVILQNTCSIFPFTIVTERCEFSEWHQHLNCMQSNNYLPR